MPSRFKRSQCAFCNEDHKSENCQIFVGEFRRKEQLTKNDRCAKCLGKGHYLGDCRANVQCLKCNQRHHTAVCLEIKRNDGHKIMSTNINLPWATGTNRTKLGKFSRLNLAKECDTVPKERKIPKSIRSLTSSIRVYHKLASLPIWTLFDTGWDQSYLDLEIAQNIGIPNKENHPIRLQPFGTEPIVVEGFKATVKVEIENCEKVDIEIWVVDNLREILGMDNSGNWLQMLIGIDYFDTFEFKATREKTQEGFTIYESRVGNVSAGKSSLNSNSHPSLSKQLLRAKILNSEIEKLRAATVRKS